MPSGEKGSIEVIQWLFAALNSACVIFEFSGYEEQAPGRQAQDGLLATRLAYMEKDLAKRFQLADFFRLVDHFDGLPSHEACRAHVEQEVSRPAFQKAPSEQMKHFIIQD